MKVKGVELAAVLGMSSGGITMACSRDRLNKTVGNLYDLDDLKNHAYICKRLAKQSRVIPVDISALFKATPITVNEKTERQNNAGLSGPGAHGAGGSGGNVATQGGQGGGGGGAEGMQGGAEGMQGGAEGGQIDLPVDGGGAEGGPGSAGNENQKRFEKVASRSAVEFEKYKAVKMKADAEGAQIRSMIARAEVIPITPYGKFLASLVSAERVQVFSALPNIAQFILNDIRIAIKDKKSDPEIIAIMVNRWTSDIEKIYEATDKDIGNRIRAAKRSAQKDTAGEMKTDA